MGSGGAPTNPNGRCPSHCRPRAWAVQKAAMADHLSSRDAARRSFCSDTRQWDCDGSTRRNGSTRPGRRTGHGATAPEVGGRRSATTGHSASGKRVVGTAVILRDRTEERCTQFGRSGSIERHRKRNCRINMKSETCATLRHCWISGRHGVHATDLGSCQGSGAMTGDRRYR